MKKLIYAGEKLVKHCVVGLMMAIALPFCFPGIVIIFMLGNMAVSTLVLSLAYCFDITNFTQNNWEIITNTLCASGYLIIVALITRWAMRPKPDDANFA